MRQLDYGAPASGARRTLVAKAVDVLLNACWDGLLEGCLQLDYYPTSSWTIGALHEAAIATGQACAQGSAPSCSVLLLHGRFASAMVSQIRPESLYLDACKTGDRVACTKVSAARACMHAEVETPTCKQLREAAPNRDAVLTLVRGFCEGGFVRACAYVSIAHSVPGFQLSDADAERYAKLACDGGDPWACDLAETLALDLGHEDILPDLTAHKPAGMAAMCKAGDWIYCRHINDPNAERLTLLACLDGESFACEFSTSIEAKEFACTSMGIECDHWLELAGDDPHKVRDILEHSCQWENVDDCQRLVLGYRAHTYDEPVPGREAALQSYVCKQDAQRCALSTASP